MAYKQSKNPFGKSPLNFSSPLNSFDSLVGKLMNQGKSKEAATKIAGKVANMKMKGAGSGPTAAQKARAKGSAAKMEESPLDKELIGNQHRLPEELKAKIEAAPESPAKMKSPMKKHSDAHIRKEAKRIARKNKGDEQDIYYELKSKYAQEKKDAAKKAKDAAKGSPAKHDSASGRRHIHTKYHTSYEGDSTFPKDKKKGGKVVEGDHASKPKKDSKKSSPANNKANGKEHAQMGRKEKFNHMMVEHPAKNPKNKKEEGKATKVIKDRKKTADLLNAKNPPSAKTRLKKSGVKADSPANISAKAAERKVKKGKGRIARKTGGKDMDAKYISKRREKRANKANDGTLKGITKSQKIKEGARKIKSSPANLKGLAKGAVKAIKAKKVPTDITKIAKRIKPQQIAKQAKLAALSGEAAIKGAIAGAAGYLAGKKAGSDKRAKTGIISSKKKSPLNNAYENPEYFVPTKSSYGQDMDNFFNTVSSAYEDRKRYGKGLEGMKNDPYSSLSDDDLAKQGYKRIN